MSHPSLVNTAVSALSRFCFFLRYTILRNLWEGMGTWRNNRKKWSKIQRRLWLWFWFFNSPCTLLTCRAHDGERLAREETVEDSHYHPRDQGLHRGHVVLHKQYLWMAGFKGRVRWDILVYIWAWRKRKFHLLNDLSLPSKRKAPSQISRLHICFSLSESRLKFLWAKILNICSWIFFSSLTISKVLPAREEASIQSLKPAFLFIGGLFRYFRFLLAPDPDSYLE